MAILKSKGKLIDSLVEEIEKDGFCSYYDKYHKDDDNDDTFKRTYPADISKALTEEICKTAKRAYSSLSLGGVARIDYIYDTKNKKLYINEINTMPGFTKISMYPKLFESDKISYSELLDILINYAISKFDFT